MTALGHDAHPNVRMEGLGLVVGRRQRLAAGDVGAIHLPERRQRGHRVAVLHQRAQRAQEVHALRVRGEPGVPAPGLGFQGYRQGSSVPQTLNPKPPAPQHALSQRQARMHACIIAAKRVCKGGVCDGALSAGHARQANMCFAASKPCLDPRTFQARALWDVAWPPGAVCPTWSGTAS